MNFKYGILLTFIFVSFKNADEIYTRHIQVCSAINAVDRKWELVLNSKGGFAYTIKTIDTKVINKSSQQVLWGNWTLVGDTLQLKVSTSDSKIKLKENELLFIKKEEKLFPLNEKGNFISGFIIELDFLAKEKS
ncbi:MAG: hypothetical protein Q8941_15965 [Bacteroidota bacterium]|nr:hypothetical protein [Bacteroidota bacterium]